MYNKIMLSLVFSTGVSEPGDVRSVPLHSVKSVSFDNCSFLTSANYVHVFFFNTQYGALGVSVQNGTVSNMIVRLMIIFFY